MKRLIWTAVLCLLGTWLGGAPSAGAVTRDGSCEAEEVCGFMHSGYNAFYVFDVAGSDSNYQCDLYRYRINGNAGVWPDICVNDSVSSIKQRRTGTYRFCKHSNGTDCFLLPKNAEDGDLSNAWGAVPGGFNDELSYHWLY